MRSSQSILKEKRKVEVWSPHLSGRKEPRGESTGVGGSSLNYSGLVVETPAGLLQPASPGFAITRPCRRGPVCSMKSRLICSKILSLCFAQIGSLNPGLMMSPPHLGRDRVATEIPLNVNTLQVYDLQGL